MPIDIERLFQSTFHAVCNAVEWRAGLTLWFRAFQQMPASSLPPDDASLALLAEFGREIGKWKKARPNAMHGWFLCSDGRYYHKVVAEKALEAWIERLAHRKSGSAGNAKRWNGEHDPDQIDAQIGAAMDCLRLLNPASRALKKRSPRDPDRIATGSQGESQQDRNGIARRSQGGRYILASEGTNPDHNPRPGDRTEVGIHTPSADEHGPGNGLDPGWDDSDPFGPEVRQ